ncbi:Voltage-gated ion channel, partial [Globisporangium splendens]
MEARRSLSKRRSSALEEERDAVAKQVEEDHERAPHKRSSYLPSSDNINSRQGDSRLRDAKKAIQTIYDIHTRYERRRAVEHASFLLAMTGIFMVFIDNEYTESELSKLYLRIANCSATLVLLGLVVWRFVIERDILIKRNVVAPHIALWRMPKQLFKLLLELLVCCICVPPGVNGSFRVWEWKFYVDDGIGTCPATFTVDDESCYLVYSYPYEVLGLLSLLRLYMLPRIIRNLSDFTNYRTSYLGVVYHVDTLSSLFAVKCFLRSHPFKFLLAVFAGALVLTGYALAIVEAPVNPQLAPLWNSMWLVVLTMGTIGYGDLASVTIAGQVLLVLGGMLAGILLVGVLSAAIFGFLGLNERDRRFIHLLRRQEYNRHLKQASARTIQAVWHRYVFRKHGLHASDPKKYKQLLDKLNRCTSKQRSLRKQNIGAYDSASTEVQRCQDQLLLSFRQEHATTMQRLRMVEKRLDTLLVAATDAVSAA